MLTAWACLGFEWSSWFRRLSNLVRDLVELARLFLAVNHSLGHGRWEDSRLMRHSKQSEQRRNDRQERSPKKPHFQVLGQARPSFDNASMGHLDCSRDYG